MAVFTQVTAEQAREIVALYDIGSFEALAPIASGIENTNYYLDTAQGRWVLTVFERLSAEQLPFYLLLTEHLAAKGCAVACPRRLRSGELIGFFQGKPFALANRLCGQDCAIMGVAECRSMGALLARMHLAALDFEVRQPNLRGLDWCAATAPRIKPYVPAGLYAKLEAEIAYQQGVAASPRIGELQSSACHCDLFRNNALISAPGTPQAQVAGVFDFYFAGCTPWLYDLAVTMNDWCIDPETGRFVPMKARAFIESYHAVRPLTDVEHAYWRDMLRMGALRFWTSRLYDWWLPREASLLKPHDPTHFERVLEDRKTCDLPWPAA
ncbi:MAG: homoserine kinase [Duodenibacillus sp.]|nr:homoserine kinase [Duodenibacillus sp.]